MGEILTYVPVVVFVGILIAAAVWDFYTLTIPDYLNVSGLMLGILLGAIAPSLVSGGAMINELTAIDRNLVQWWNIDPANVEVQLPLFCSLFIVFAVFVMPAKWRGVRRVEEFVKDTVRSSVRTAKQERWKFFAVTGVLFGILVGWNSGLVNQAGARNALVGATFAMLTAWAIRILGEVSAGQEALGFGDVLMLGAIGAWTGWQLISTVWIFAVTVGIVWGVRTTLTTKNDLPFGPSLAVGGVLTIVCQRLGMWNEYLYLPTAMFVQAGPELVLIVIGLGTLLFYPSLRLLLWITGRNRPAEG